MILFIVPPQHTISSGLKITLPFDFSIQILYLPKIIGKYGRCVNKFLKKIVDNKSCYRT